MTFCVSLLNFGPEWRLSTSFHYPHFRQGCCSSPIGEGHIHSWLTLCIVSSDPCIYQWEPLENFDRASERANERELSLMIHVIDFAAVMHCVTAVEEEEEKTSLLFSQGGWWKSSPQSTSAHCLFLLRGDKKGADRRTHLWTSTHKGRPRRRQRRLLLRPSSSVQSTLTRPQLLACQGSGFMSLIHPENAVIFHVFHFWRAR